MTASVVKKSRFYEKGAEYAVKCSAKGFPLPRISWLFKPCSSYVDCDNSRKRVLSHMMESSPTPYRKESSIRQVAHESGLIICMACNNIGSPGCTNVFLPFFVSDVKNGFNLEGPRKAIEGDNIKLTCSASVLQPDKIQWFKITEIGDVELNEETSLEINKGLYKIVTTSTHFSFSKELVFPNVSLIDKGRYMCRVTMERNPYDDSDNEIGSKVQNSYYNEPVLSASRRYYNDASLDLESKFYQKEMTLDLTVLSLKVPVFTRKTLYGSQTVVENPEDGLSLECRITGRPRPNIQWTLNGNLLRPSTNTTIVQFSDDNQVLRVSYITDSYQGLYGCHAENKAGSVNASELIQLRSTLNKDTYYSMISYPIIAAVVISIILVLLLLIIAKLCYSRCHWKNPPPPPATPRLKQYELPFDRTMDIDDDDDCRMTLTSTRDGSISPYHHHAPPSVISHCHCHYSACPSTVGTLPHSSPVPSMYPKCSLCDFSVQTLPMNRMMTLKRLENPYVTSPSPMMPSNTNTTVRSGSHSPIMAPRLSAEF